MIIKTLINKLKKFDSKKPIRFYFLENYNLEGCELETILRSDGWVELTVKKDNTDEGGCMWWKMI